MILLSRPSWLQSVNIRAESNRHFLRPSLLAQDGGPPHERHGLLVLVAARVLEVPELDVAVAGRHEVVAVLGEGDRLHLHGDLQSSKKKEV